MTHRLALHCRLVALPHGPARAARPHMLHAEVNVWRFPAREVEEPTEQSWLSQNCPWNPWNMTWKSSKHITSYYIILHICYTTISCPKFKSNAWIAGDIWTKSCVTRHVRPCSTTKKRHVANLGIWLNQRPREAFQEKETRHSWWQPLVQVRWRTSLENTARDAERCWNCWNTPEIDLRYTVSDIYIYKHI